MANFGGLIGLEQLSPEVLEFIQKLVDDAIANAGPIAPPEEKMVAEFKGVVVTSQELPPEEDNTDTWVKPTDETFPEKVLSTNILIGTEYPEEAPTPGDVFVKKK